MELSVWLTRSWLKQLVYSMPCKSGYSTCNFQWMGYEPVKYSGFSAVEVLEQQFDIGCFKAVSQIKKQGRSTLCAPECFTLVEARGTQPWVASFHSDQRLRLPQCRRTFSSISGMSVVVWWWLVWWHSSALWKQEKQIGLKMWRKGPKLQSSPRTRAVVGDLYWYQRCQEFVLYSPQNKHSSTLLVAWSKG